MVDPSKRELEHATRYATEATKLFLMQEFKKKYPHLFREATIETRPATLKDYYIPPSLAAKCIVVTRTAFTQEGCRRVACFPYKENMEPCEETDDPRWVPMGSHYTLACQPTCFEEKYIDTEWRNDACVLINPLRKVVAIFPEKLFDIKTKHPLHTGLEIEEDRLKLNGRYCEAYGLDFDGRNCDSTQEQSIAEFIMGKTVYRTIRLKNTNPYARSPPPPVPNYPKRVKRRKRSIGNDQAEFDASQLAADIANDLAIDSSIDAGAWMIQHILKKKVPKLIVKATSDIVLKSALKQAVMKSYVDTTLLASQAMGKTVGVISNVYAVYSLVSMILDSIDPYNFEKVLNTAMLKDIDRKLDLQYYQREDGNNQKVTPEYVWDHVLDTDESERYEYMAEKMKEYIGALHAQPSKDPLPPLIDVKMASRQVEARWNWTVHAALVFMITTITGIFWQWIHVWATLLFMILAVYTRRS